MRKLLFVLAAISFFSYSQNEPHIQAVDAFNNGDYAKALMYFQQQADQTGLSYDLGYNLAVCYYKLEQWQEASQLFMYIYQQNTEDWFVLYSLAVTKKKIGNEEQASQYFLDVALQTDHLTLAEQATEQYLLLNPHVLDEWDSPPAIVGDVSIQYGMDDNVTEYSSDFELTTKTDAFSDLYAGLSWYSDSDLSDSWVMDALVYITQYQQTDNYDYELLAVTGGKYLTLSEKQLFIGINMEYSSLAFDPYLAYVDVNMALTLPLGSDYTIDTRYRYRHIESLAKAFDDEHGQNQRLEIIAGYQKYKVARWQLGYRYEYDDLDGEASEGESYNLSGSHNRLNVTGMIFFPYWQFSLNASYYDVYYKHRFMDDDGIQKKRYDTRISTGVSVIWLLTSSTSLSLNYGYSNNQSTLDKYQYDRNMITTGVRWQF